MQPIKIKTKRNRIPRPRYNLELQAGKPKSTPHLIYLIYRIRKDKTDPTGKKWIRLKYSTSRFVPKANFDQKMQIAVSGTRYPQDQTDNLNQYLDALKKEATRILKENPEISVQDFKLYLDYFTGDASKPKTKADYTLLDYFDVYITKSNNLAKTIEKYETAQTHIKEYQKDILEDKPITFEMVNVELVQRIADFLYKTRNLATSSAQKTIRILKQVTRDAYENGYHTNSMYQSKNFKIDTIKTTKHFLELQELEKLQSSKKIVKDHHKRARDLWLIMAWTGLRVSDLRQLDFSKHIKTVEGKQVIELYTMKGRTTKNDTKVVISVLPQLKKMLKRLDYKKPEMMPEQKINKNIKEILELIQINETVQHKATKGGKVVLSEVLKRTKISNHSARYSFINFMINDYGTPPIELKKMTGQDLQTLEGYERGDKAKNAAKVGSRIEQMEMTKERDKMKVV